MSVVSFPSAIFISFKILFFSRKNPNIRKEKLFYPSGPKEPILNCFIPNNRANNYLEKLNKYPTRTIIEQNEEPSKIQVNNNNNKRSSFNKPSFSPPYGFLNEYKNLKTNNKSW